MSHTNLIFNTCIILLTPPFETESYGIDVLKKAWSFSPHLFSQCCLLTVSVLVWLSMVVSWPFKVKLLSTFPAGIIDGMMPLALCLQLVSETQQLRCFQTQTTCDSGFAYQSGRSRSWRKILNTIFILPILLSLLMELVRMMVCRSAWSFCHFLRYF